MKRLFLSAAVCLIGLAGFSQWAPGDSVMTPLSYKDFTVRQIPHTDSIEVKVTFYESYNVNHVNIMTSTDGHTWFRAKVFLPENIVGQKRYFVRARIARGKNNE